MLLGIRGPWRVKRAKLEMEQRTVDIEVEDEPGMAVRCPHASVLSKRFAQLLRKPITNAITEGFNSRIRSLRVSVTGRAW